MAAVLQHQIAGRVNDLNQKMGAHARLIFQVSLELDKLKQENEELKKILKGHKIAIKQLKSEISDKSTTSNGLNNSSNVDSQGVNESEASDDITLARDNLKNEYNEYSNDLTNGELYQDKEQISLSMIK